MSLSECRECGNEVSDEAESCPECGVPNPAGESSGSGCGTGCGTAATVIFLVLAVLWIIGASMDSDSSRTTGDFESASSTQVHVTDTSGPAAKLAAIDADSRYVSRSQLRQYRSAMDQAEEDCTNSRQEISDTVATGVELAAEDGMTVTHLELLESLPLAVPDETAPMDCKQVLAATLTLLANQ